MSKGIFDPRVERWAQTHKEKSGQLDRWAAGHRSNPTPAEQRTIDALKRLSEPFQSQVLHRSVKRIADIQLDRVRLILEIDGDYHDDPVQAADDAERDRQFAAKGYRVVRLSNDETLRLDFAARLAAIIEDGMNDAIARRYPFGKIDGRWGLASQS